MKMGGGGGEETPVHTDRNKCGSFLAGFSKKTNFNKSVKQAQKDGVHKVTKVELEKVKDRSRIHGNHLLSKIRFVQKPNARLPVHEDLFPVLSHRHSQNIVPF